MKINKFFKYIIIIFELILLQSILTLFPKKIFNNSNKINDIKQNLIKKSKNYIKIQRKILHILMSYIYQEMVVDWEIFLYVLTMQ